MIEELYLLLPHILLSISIIFWLVVDGLWKNKTLNFWGAVVSLVATFLSVFISLEHLPVQGPLEFSRLLTKGMLSFDGFAYYFDLIFISAGIFTILSSRNYQREKYIELNELYTLVLISVFGMLIISHSTNFLTLFLGIETMSLSFYVLAGFFRKSFQSVEAGIKYFLLGAFATGFLVYGIAFVYGATKSLYFIDISNIIQKIEYEKIYISLGLILVFVGLAFKVAAFPFHQWAPDVYTGAPTTISAFMSTAGKASAIFSMFLIAKNVLSPFSFVESTREFFKDIQLILALISAATMLVGNFIALVQKNVKRMLAYSSVAHAGYLLMGIVANNRDGWNAIAFYSLAYLLMQFGAFIVLSLSETKDNDFNSLEDFYGLSKKHPFLAGTMSIFMLSLAGIPPFAGFFGKYLLFVSTIKSGFLWLTIVAVISSIISMYYYIGLILAMYFKEHKEVINPRFGLPFVVVIVCLVLTLAFGIFPQLIVDFTTFLLG